MVCSNFLDVISGRVDGLLLRATLLDKTWTDAELNWQPPNHGWTAGQILEHVRLANAQYLPVMEAAISTARFGDDVPASLTLFGRLLVKASGPSGNAPVPKPWIPAAKPYGKDVIATFITDHERLRNLATSAEGIDLTRTKVGNPLFPLVKMNLVDCFEVVAGHGERHLGQIEELGRLPNFAE